MCECAKSPLLAHVRWYPGPRRLLLRACSEAIAYRAERQLTPVVSPRIRRPDLFAANTPESRRPRSFSQAEPKLRLLRRR